VHVRPVSLDTEVLAPLRRPNAPVVGVRPCPYLAGGLPVVTTSVAEAAKYAGTVAVAADGGAFVGAVREALGTGREASRSRGQSLARERTCQRRAETVLQLDGELVVEREAEATRRTVAGRA